MGGAPLGAESVHGEAGLGVELYGSPVHRWRGSRTVSVVAGSLTSHVTTTYTRRGAQETNTL